jgi:hypothetical protein
MIDAFNDHYSKGYKPSWVLCINESVNTWLILNKFCPGFHSLASRIHSATPFLHRLYYHHGSSVKVSPRGLPRSS